MALDVYMPCSVILETEPAVIASRVTMRGAEGEGPVAEPVSKAEGTGLLQSCRRYQQWTTCLVSDCCCCRWQSRHSQKH
jgi:hypothetical protein